MVRFGVVGTNWITDRFIEAASQHPDFQLVAVYSRTEERAKEFATIHHAGQTFTNLEEMANSKEIDAVYIASPNSFHAQQSITFLENKKHVLCEKPIASNTKELSLMIEAAKENDVLLMEAMKTTFLPNFQSLKHNLSKIGVVRRACFSFCQYSSRYDAYKEGNILNAFKPEFSNGALMDIGVYCLYPIIYLFGMPNVIKANAYLLETGVDGEGSIILKYDEMEAVVSFSKITNSFVPSEIQGEKGSIVINKVSSPEDIKIYYRNGNSENISVAQENHTMFYEVKEFIELIEQGKTESNVNTYETSLSVMRVMDEARKQMGIVYQSDNRMN